MGDFMGSQRRAFEVVRRCDQEQARDVRAASCPPMDGTTAPAFSCTVYFFYISSSSVILVACFVRSGINLSGNRLQGELPACMAAFTKIRCTST
jgi:hypothetical protein